MVATSRAIWAWRCPLLAGHSARTFSGICRRGGGRRAYRTLFLDRCFRCSSPERVHPATCPWLSRAFLSSPHPHRLVAAFGPSPLPGSGGSVVSSGRLDAEKLSSSPCRDDCCTQMPCTLRLALPSALQRSRGGLAGGGSRVMAPAAVPGGLQPVPGRGSRLGPCVLFHACRRPRPTAAHSSLEPGPGALGRGCLGRRCGPQAGL